MIRWLNHTADIQIEIICDRYEEIFVDFVEELRTLLVTGEVQSLKAEKMGLKEADPSALLVSLGRQVLFYFNMKQFVSSHLEVHTATPTTLKGILWGQTFDPHRHEYNIEVKGITYHDLKVENGGGKWFAIVTFDV